MLERALAAAPEPTPERAQALLAAIWVAQTQGDLATADRWLDEADALGERLGDPALRVQAAGFRGVSAHYRGRPAEAMERYAEALAAMTELGDERQSVSWLIALACAQAYAGDPVASETSGRMIAAAEASGERWGRAQVLMALGHDAWTQGDRERTEALARSALECMRGFDDYAMVARMLELLAWATAADGTHARAAGPPGCWVPRTRCGGMPAVPSQRSGRRWPHSTSSARRRSSTCWGERPMRWRSRTAVGTAAPAGPWPSPLPTAPVPSPTTMSDRPSPPTRCRVGSRRWPLVAKGLSNRQIAAELVLSPRTADRHVENILAKFGFGSRTRIAVRWTANQVSVS